MVIDVLLTALLPVPSKRALINLKRTGSVE
jgi:hypothetical protein